MTATEVASRIRDFGGRGVIKSHFSQEGVGRELLAMDSKVESTWSHR